MDAARAASALTAWYAAHARDLPWRRDPSPYHVLVAEFVLQQTRIETGRDYYERFLKRFPTLERLARARPQDVLRLWSGLGYYARARRLHETARRILQDFGGRVPDEPEILRTLPGIGPYTAGAIASIAYDRPVPAIDGNQARVLGRVLGVRDPQATKTGRRLHTTATAWLKSGSPRILNQALMDLGNAVCLPREPHCGRCPLATSCRARVRMRPHPRRPAARGAVEDWEALVHARGRRLWLRAPRDRGLLAHLWLPPLRPARRAVADPDVVHRFSHKTWRIRWVRTRRRPPGPGRWAARSELDRLPHGRLTQRLFEAFGRGVAAGARPRGEAGER